MVYKHQALVYDILPLKGGAGSVGGPQSGLQHAYRSVKWVLVREGNRQMLMENMATGQLQLVNDSAASKRSLTDMPRATTHAARARAHARTHARTHAQARTHARTHEHSPSPSQTLTDALLAVGGQVVATPAGTAGRAGLGAVVLTP